MTTQYMAFPFHVWWFLHDCTCSRYNARHLQMCPQQLLPVVSPDISKVVVWMARPVCSLTMQLVSYQNEMRNIDQYNRTRHKGSRVRHKRPVRVLPRISRSKNLRQSPPPVTHNWKQWRKQRLEPGGKTKLKGAIGNYRGLTSQHSKIEKWCCIRIWMVILKP